MKLFLKRSATPFARPLPDTVSFSLLLMGLLLVFTGLNNQAAARQLNFTIIHTSDEHSSLLPAPLGDYLANEPSPARGGFARLSTLVKQIRSDVGTETVLLLSSGDFSGGTPFAWLGLSGNSIELELMKEIGYNATVLGNHEFDYGPDSLVQRLNSPAPPLLSSNLVIPEGHPLQNTGIRRNLLLTTNLGIKIGIFALLGKGAHRLSPTAKPLDFSDQHAAARREIAALQASGAAVIIALTHSGYYEDVELAEKVSNIDLILGGHDHLAFDKPVTVGKTIIMHSGSYLRTAGRLDLCLDSSSRHLRLRNHALGAPFLYSLDSNIAENKTIGVICNQMLVELNAAIASYSDGLLTNMITPIARSSRPLIKHQAICETSVGNFIADAMRLEAAKVTGRHVDFAIHANGIIRGDIHPSTLASTSGAISLYDLVTTCCLGSGADGRPGYPLVSFYVTGAEMLNLLEVATLLPILWSDVYFLQFSGLRYWYDANRAIWFNIPFVNKPLPAYRSILRAERYTGDGVQHTENFAPISRDQRLYHVTTTHYMASYLPMAGRKLPRLKIVFKNSDGKPLELDETIIRHNNGEFKLWEAVVRYAAGFATDSSGLPVIPDYYQEHGGRIIPAKGQSLWLWPGIMALTATGLLLFHRCWKSLHLPSAEPPDTIQ